MSFMHVFWKVRILIKMVNSPFPFQNSWFFEMSKSLPVNVFFRNVKFTRKTVFVKDNNVDLALKACTKWVWLFLLPALQTFNFDYICRILKDDKILKNVSDQTYYTKPSEWRRTFMYQRCKRVYDDEMSRKIRFVMQAHRTDPWPRWR